MSLLSPFVRPSSTPPDKPQPPLSATAPRGLDSGARLPLSEALRRIRGDAPAQPSSEATPPTPGVEPPRAAAGALEVPRSPGVVRPEALEVPASAAETPADDRPTPLARFVAAWAKLAAAETVAAIRRGEMAQKYIGGRLGDVAGQARKKKRAALVAEAVAALQARGVESRVNRALLRYHLAEALGRAEAEAAPLRVLDAFSPLVKRNADDSYSLQAQEAAKALWGRWQAERLDLATIRAAVARLMGRAPKASPKRKAGGVRFDWGTAAAAATPADLDRLVAGLSAALMEHLRTAIARPTAARPAAA